MTDLAALVAMRLTHDLAGPLGAVSTGIDLLDGGDPEIRALIADGTAAAVASLRLHRFILAPTGDATLAQGLLAAWIATREGITLDWRTPPDAADIALGLAMTAVEAARRGGTLVVDGLVVMFTPAPALDTSVTAALEGDRVTIPRAALAGILHATAMHRGGIDCPSATDGDANYGLRLPWQRVAAVIEEHADVRSEVRPAMTARRPLTDSATSTSAPAPPMSVLTQPGWRAATAILPALELDGQCLEARR